MVDMSSPSEWYYVVDDEAGRHRAGPVSSETLAALLSSGELSEATPVWQEGMSDWVQARTLLGELHAEQWQILQPARDARQAEPPPGGGGGDAAADGPADGVVVRNTGCHTIRYSRSRNALLVYTDDYHAGPLVLKRGDLLRLLLAMEEPSGG
jgi:hypothetical protein